MLNQRNRRGFLKMMGTGALGAMATTMLPRSAHAQEDLDPAVLNFALNLEYLEAEFYTYATTGMGIESKQIDVDGDGTPGVVIIKSDAKVPFMSDEISQYAEEIATNEQNHVVFLRTALINAGVTPVARPTIDLLDSFNAAAQAAGIGDSFDPFANDLNFLLGAFIFEDVGVTAYKGAAPLISNKTYLEAAAGILAVEAYHAGLIRTLIYQAGASAQEIAGKISDLRGALDGEGNDQPVVVDGKANIVPADEFSIAFSRSTTKILNIVYADLEHTGQPGGFFPDGFNGTIR